MLFPRNGVEKMIRVTCLACLFALLLMPACGSDADFDDDDQGAAFFVDVSVEPSHIDSGDRTTVRINFGNLQDPAVAIKVRFPEQLSYVDRSGYFVIGGEVFRDVPDDGGTASPYSFVVFYFRTAELSLDPTGELVFELEGFSDIRDGKVGVDIDIDNPDISNLEEFSISDPRFDALAEDDIQVGIFSSSSSSTSTSTSSSTSSTGSSSSSSSSSTSSSSTSSGQ